MATKLYDCAVVVGTYRTQNGQEKNRWENIGAVWQSTNNNGEKNTYITLKASFSPAGIPKKEGSDSIFVSLFKPQSNNNTQQQQRTQTQGNSQQGTQASVLSFTPDNNLPFNNNDGANVEECPF